MTEQEWKQLKFGDIIELENNKEHLPGARFFVLDNIQGLVRYIPFNEASDLKKERRRGVNDTPYHEFFSLV